MNSIFTTYFYKFIIISIILTFILFSVACTESTSTNTVEPKTPVTTLTHGRKIV